MCELIVALSGELCNCPSMDDEVKAYGDRVWNLKAGAVWSKKSCIFPVVKFQQPSQALTCVDPARRFADPVRRPRKQNHVPVLSENSRFSAELSKIRLFRSRILARRSKSAGQGGNRDPSLR